MADNNNTDVFDPDEENLKLVYETLLTYYEKVNQQKLDDEDSLAVIMDYWIDYGLHALNQRLNKKYGERIRLDNDPFAGGLIARKNISKKGWPFPPNHPQYKDPLSSHRPEMKDDSRVLPPPTNAPPALKANVVTAKANVQSSSGSTGPSSNKFVPAASNLDRKQKKDDEGRINDRISASRPGKHTTHQSAKSPKNLTNRENQVLNPEERKGHANNADSRISQKNHRSGEEYRKSKHYRPNRRQQNGENRRSGRDGYGPQKVPKQGIVVTNFENLEQFDNPSDIPLSPRDLLEAYYGRYNRVVVASSAGVGPLLRWVESHNLGELDKLLISKYGQSINDKEIQKEAIRRKNLERKIFEIFEHYDRARAKRMEIMNLVNVAMFDGVTQLNKELKAMVRDNENQQRPQD